MNCNGEYDISNKIWPNIATRMRWVNATAGMANQRNQNQKYEKHHNRSRNWRGL